MNRYHLLAANYNPDFLWVYDELARWLAERDVGFAKALCANEAETIERASSADILITFQLPVRRRVIAALPKLKLLMASGSGYDHIDVAAATEHGVVVTNSATHNREEVADHTLALILACGRKLRRMESLVRQGRWQVSGAVYPIRRFAGQTVGLIGFGNIGQAVARRALALGFRVLAHDPNVSADHITSLGAEPAALETLLEQSDFVSLHVRLTHDTRHLLNAARLELMKPTAFVINTSRGGVIDEQALIAALERGRIAGAGLDVLETEPPALNNPLLSMDNVIVTGHGAGGSVEAVQAWQDEWRRTLDQFLAGQMPANTVNPGVRPKIALKDRETSDR